LRTASFEIREFASRKIAGPRIGKKITPLLAAARVPNLFMISTLCLVNPGGEASTILRRPSDQ
jgi:hypothetical protein